MKNTRQDCQEAINKLNLYYGKCVKMIQGCANDSPSPCCDYIKNAILLPNSKVFYDLRVIAHEYAHFIIPASSPDYYSQHDDRFESAYKECCIVLGLFAIPTSILVNETINKYNKRYGTTIPLHIWRQPC